MSEKENYNTIPMIEKACQVVDVISKEGGAAGISEIARQTGMSKSTIFRVLYTLQSWNWIQKDEASDRYRLGLFFLQAGKQVAGKLKIEEIARPVMERVAEETGEGVNLGTCFEDRVLILENVQGEASLLVLGLQPVFDLYCSGMGKLFLSEMTDEQLHDYFQRMKPEQKTDGTITTEAEMKAELQQIRQQGYSLDNEEYEYGLLCVAAPIRNRGGKMIAGISVSGPASRMKRGKGVAAIQASVLSGAAEIEERMGFHL